MNFLMICHNSNGFDKINDPIINNRLGKYFHIFLILSFSKHSTKLLSLPNIKNDITFMNFIAVPILILENVMIDRCHIWR